MSLKRNHSARLILFVFLTSCATAKAHTRVAGELIQFKNSEHVLSFELLSDSLLHFDYSSLKSGTRRRSAASDLASGKSKSYEGVNDVRITDTGFETRAAHVEVDSETLCFTLTDLARGEELTRMCPHITKNGNAFTMDAMKMQNIYGLGEQFKTPNVINGDWSGKVRTPGGKFGNTMVDYEGAAVGNAQFPVFYALGPKFLNYGFYLDTVYPYRWDFTKSPWKITQEQSGTDTSFRGYFILGADLPNLRSQFMDLVGRPPVPPKKALGLWVSEYGYRNWGEIEDKLSTLRAHHFPIDGFVLDLYWFGGTTENDPSSHMGALAWDTVNFPEPKARISRFQKDDGIGLMTIEESYVSTALPLTIRFWIGIFW